jgi:hypothetical protein
MNCNNNKIIKIPTMTSLHDNRCWDGKCIVCKKITEYCQHIKKYICCEHCKESGYNDCREFRIVKKG